MQCVNSTHCMVNPSQSHGMTHLSCDSQMCSACRIAASCTMLVVRDDDCELHRQRSHCLSVRFTTCERVQMPTRKQFSAPLNVATGMTAAMLFRHLILADETPSSFRCAVTAHKDCSTCCLASAGRLHLCLHSAACFHATLHKGGKTG